MRIYALTFLMLCVALAGCGGGPPAEQTEPAAPAEQAEATAAEATDPVATAVAIARELEADPEAAAAILERHGLTPETFDELMYTIAADPDLARRYREALQP